MQLLTDKKEAFMFISLLEFQGPQKYGGGGLFFVLIACVSMQSVWLSNMVFFSESKTLWSVQTKSQPKVMVFLPSCLPPIKSVQLCADKLRGFCHLSDPWPNWLSPGWAGLWESSCGLGGGPQSQESGSLHAKVTIVSVVVLKSFFVDVEDFDRVVGAGTGKLHPGALLCEFSLVATLSIRLAALYTCSAGSGPPAESLDCQRVALSTEGSVMKGNNHTFFTKVIILITDKSRV